MLGHHFGTSRVNTRAQKKKSTVYINGWLFRVHLILQKICASLEYLYTYMCRLDMHVHTLLCVALSAPS